MSALTQMQRDAMAQAQRGQWALADAIEIEARMQSDGTCIGGYLQGDRLRLLAFAEDCEAEGFGTEDEMTKVKTLNGDAVWRIGQDEPNFGRFVDLGWSRHVIEQYRKDQAKAELRASGQTTLIPETV